MEFRLSQSLFMNFFIWWNFGYHGAFSRTFLSHNGISAIMEPSRELFFHIMEFRLSRSLFTIFFIWWNFGYHRAFHELFFHTMEFGLSQRLFTNFSFIWWNFGYHGAFSRTFLSHNGISARLLMIFFSYDGISAITKPSHELFFT
jgi:hypothetical protein